MPFQKGNKIGHRFKKGESGNPGGGRHGLEELKKAIAKVEKQQGKPFFEYCIERAYQPLDGGMASAILRKLVPDLKHLEGEVKLEHVNMMREVIKELGRKKE